MTMKDGHEKKKQASVKEHRPNADLLCLTSPPLGRAWEAGATASGRAQCTSTQTPGTAIPQAMAGTATALKHPETEDMQPLHPKPCCML